MNHARETGDRAELVADPRLPGTTLMTARYQRQRFRPHSHDDFVICAVEEGVCAIDVSGSQRRIAKGMLSLIEPGAVHTGECASDRLRYRLAYLDRARAERLYGLEPGGRATLGFRCGHPRSPRLAAEFGEAHRACDAGIGPSEASDLDGVLREILHRWALPVERAAALPPEPLMRARRRLEASFDDNISLDELASLAHLSRFHFVRAFKAAFGLPPHSWLIQYRIERSKQFLERGFPLAEVALQVGFSDQSHFGNHFRSIVGTTPGRYRTWLSGRRASRSRRAGR